MQIYEITEAELLAADSSVVGQPVLMVLKSKGAPVTGTLILDVDSGYEVTSYKSFNGTYVYEFRKRGKNGKGND